MKGINIFLADGFEDIEALATNDVLIRGGLETRLISINGSTAVTSSHGLSVIAGSTLKDTDLSAAPQGEKDIMIFPGGMPGSSNLASCGPLMDAMEEHYASGGTAAAICAAPGLVLSRIGNLDGVVFTCYEGFQDALTAKGAVFSPQAAVRSGRIITGRSAAHAVSFALEILSLLRPEKVEEVRHSMYLWTA